MQTVGAVFETWLYTVNPTSEQRNWNIHKLNICSVENNVSSQPVQSTSMLFLSHLLLNDNQHVHKSDMVDIKGCPILK